MIPSSASVLQPLILITKRQVEFSPTLHLHLHETVRTPFLWCLSLWRPIVCGERQRERRITTADGIGMDGPQKLRDYLGHPHPQWRPPPDHGHLVPNHRTLMSLVWVI